MPPGAPWELLRPPRRWQEQAVGPGPSPIPGCPWILLLEPLEVPDGTEGVLGTAGSWAQDGVGGGVGVSALTGRGDSGR